MSVDALAVLRIEKLAPPRDATTGIELHVAHRGDASVISTFAGFRGVAPDEVSLALRKRLGPALEAHDDPRGILFFPDVLEFRGKNYDTIVSEVAWSGFWAPKVDIDHVPIRYKNAAPGTHDELLGKMIERMGRDAAIELDLVAQVNHFMEATGQAPLEGAALHRAELSRTMGSEFLARYEASLAEKVREDRALQAARFESMGEFQERAARGEPLVSEGELTAFLESGGGDAVLGNLEPSMRAELEEQLAGLDLEGLPDSDLGKQLARALKRVKG